MRITRALPLLFAAAAFVACGSSSKKNPDAHATGDGPGTDTADAPNGTADAPASAGLTCEVAGNPPAVTGCDGLQGQSGVTCLYGQAMTGFCTTACSKAQAVTATADGSNILDSDYTAAETKGDAACNTLYGSLAPAGQAHCELPINFKPAPNTDGSLTPNGKYTADFYCQIECGQTGQAACPAGMVCNMGVCDHP